MTTYLDKVGAILEPVRQAAIDYHGLTGKPLRGARGVTTDPDEVGEIFERVRQAEIDYHELTGKSLRGNHITGAMGEYLTARLLGLQLLEAREPGHDAIDDADRKIQIKARLIPKAEPPSGRRVGTIRLDGHWDCVMLILLDETFEPQEIYEADRSGVEEALTRQSSREGNENNPHISAFIKIGKKVWPKEGHPA